MLDDEARFHNDQYQRQLALKLAVTACCKYGAGHQRVVETATQYLEFLRRESDAKA